MGRPKEDISLYDKYVKGKEELIIADCRNGADLKGLAARLGCGLTTVKKIKRECPEFNELIKDSRDEADLKVESALYRRALGYEYEEVSTEVRVNQDGVGTTTYVKKTKKQVPPDTTAQIFWLKNRKPDSWRDKQEVKVETNSYIEALKELAEQYEAEDQ